MASQRSLRRLRLIRQREEEQRKLELESATSTKSRLLKSLHDEVSRTRAGWNLVLDGARSGNLADRLAGLAELRMSHSRVRGLSEAVEAMETNLANLRDSYLAKRTEHRQVQCLIEAISSREASKTARQTQQTLDENHAARFQSVRNSVDAKHQALPERIREDPLI